MSESNPVDFPGSTPADPPFEPAPAAPAPLPPPAQKKGSGLKILFLALGAFSLLVLVGIVALIYIGSKSAIPDKTILELNLETAYPEIGSSNPFAAFGKKELTLREVIGAIDKAGEDPHVVGLVSRIGVPGGGGISQVQEIRDAIKRFRSKKKFAIAFSETFGEFGPGTGAYYAATAFDEIYLQPSGDIGLHGLVLETPFLRGTFDMLGVKPEFDHRKEYKNAMNTYMEKAYTPAHREAMDSILRSIWGQVVRGIAEGRKMSEDEVRALVDRGPFLGPEAVKERLVDGLVYWDELLDKVKTKGGSGSVLRTVSAYFAEEGMSGKEGSSTIALIYGIGGVARGKSKNDGFSGATMGSDSVTKAFRKASEDKDVKAIVFRVDSPGGSYVASDAIWREVLKAKKAGKPVVVSMGDVAGSGGYFVAMCADKIVAQPSTITGSIGVLGGKLVTKAMWEKIGLTFDQVEIGQNANMWNTSRSYSEAEWSRFQAWLDRVYDDFTNKVAEGRKLPLGKVQEIAKGRIWSGEDALKIGLVDELGGLDKAVSVARGLAKIPEKEKVKIEIYPRAKTPFETLAAALNKEEDDFVHAADTQAVAEAAEALRPLLKQLARAGLLGESRGVLTMPEVIVSP